MRRGRWRLQPSAGREPLYAALPSYVFIMGGGAVINLSYCFIRLAALKRLSLRADMASAASGFEERTPCSDRRDHVVPAFFFYAWGRPTFQSGWRM